MEPEDQKYHDAEMDVAAMEEVALDWCDWYAIRSLVFYVKAVELDEDYTFMFNIEYKRLFNQLFGR